ncbi:hypothetical protein [Labrys sp. ZIDIC5]|uniref:hypothetical protein n=1 Tax=Labrys sedimenti TaxID=3106036 RepID=UPI002ACAEC03|nr:hypothetical protein [Labrys sp. ZIDIC5]MDZ5448743.1 hypothetical protein [Labrys sp. ZIDIC5]
MGIFEGRQHLAKMPEERLIVRGRADSHPMGGCHGRPIDVMLLEERILFGESSRENVEIDDGIRGIGLRTGRWQCIGACELGLGGDAVHSQYEPVRLSTSPEREGIDYPGVVVDAGADKASGIFGGRNAFGRDRLLATDCRDLETLQMSAVDGIGMAVSRRQPYAIGEVGSGPNRLRKQEQADKEHAAHWTTSRETAVLAAKIGMPVNGRRWSALQMMQRR